MISFIRGILDDVTDSTVVIDCGGVGYEMFVPQSVFKVISRTGEEVKLYTYLQVREDAVTLFGFADRDELELFKQLITVSGIGPKGALSILSTIGADDLRFAVLSDDVKTISSAPGIGAKTAGKLVIELKDKLKLADAFETKLSKKLKASDACEESVADVASLKLQKSEAVQALTALGYSQTEAAKAVRSVEVHEGMEADEILKAALRFM